MLSVPQRHVLHAAHQAAAPAPAVVPTASPAVAVLANTAHVEYYSLVAHCLLAQRNWGALPCKKP